MATGVAAPDYNDPYLFFKKTYFTEGLRHLLARVNQKLVQGQGGSVIEIQTPFGGGKTHALVAIHRRGAAGVPTPVIRGGGVQSIVIVAKHWGMTTAQIAAEYELAEAQVSEVLSFYTLSTPRGDHPGGAGQLDLSRAHCRPRPSAV